MTRQVLFVQGGGGKNAHDEWDNKLVESLERELGLGYEIRYPRMPDENNPRFAPRKTALRKEVNAKLGMEDCDATLRRRE